MMRFQDLRIKKKRIWKKWKVYRPNEKLYIKPSQDIKPRKENSNVDKSILLYLYILQNGRD